MRAPRAWIAGVEGLALTSEEIALFSSCPPWGLILFRRNVGSLPQIAQLIARFREVVGRPDAPVLIDQEGGRVQRIAEPLLCAYPSAASMAALYHQNRENARRATYLHARLISHDLYALGINVNCLPLLDLLQPQTHGIIGDRALGADPHQVADLGRQCCLGHLDGGVLPVIKHIPGHGRATVDSHEALPRVTASAEAMFEHDLWPFKALRDMPLAMTAHIVYDAWDAQNCATQSAFVVQNIIREVIGYKGLLMTDDLSMHALEGSFEDRTNRSLQAGCDVVLHCNGHLDEMQAIASVVPELAGHSLERARHAQAKFKPAQAFDDKAARQEFEQLLRASVKAA